MTDLKTDLKIVIGKSISEICPNNFHSNNSNHCAHFVSHMLPLEFSYNCKNYKGGNKQAGNIRVQEIFPKCPKVGNFDDAPLDRPVLVFVTRKDVVDLKKKQIKNIPQKHIGIYIDGFIYHYSNSKNKVVKWTIDRFFNTYQASYAGDQGLYFGTVPESDLSLKVDMDGQDISDNFAFELIKRDKKWYGRNTSQDPDSEFYIGRETLNNAKGYYGIYRRIDEYEGPVFNPEDYITKIDHWAYLLYATGYCESKNHFNLINTYDRAKFTYGFSQLAAHTPNDNLILFFKELVKLDQAKDYFPEIKIVDGKLQRQNQDGGITNLEEVLNTGPNGSTQLQLFMNFLNPHRRQIDDQEVLHAARLIHWTSDPKVQELQVDIANNILQKKMTRYSKWYNLDGQTDIICTLVADIHHQGRASKKKVKIAMNTQDPFEALININSNYKNRTKNLRHIVNELKISRKMGQKTYDAANNEFI